MDIIFIFMRLGHKSKFFMSIGTITMAAFRMIINGHLHKIGYFSSIFLSYFLFRIIPFCFAISRSLKCVDPCVTMTMCVYDVWTFKCLAPSVEKLSTHLWWTDFLLCYFFRLCVRVYCTHEWLRPIREESFGFNEWTFIILLAWRIFSHFHINRNLWITQKAIGNYHLHLSWMVFLANRLAKLCVCVCVRNTFCLMFQSGLSGTVAQCNWFQSRR